MIVELDGHLDRAFGIRHAELAIFNPLKAGRSIGVRLTQQFLLPGAIALAGQRLAIPIAGIWIRLFAQWEMQADVLVPDSLRIEIYVETCPQNAEHGFFVPGQDTDIDIFVVIGDIVLEGVGGVAETKGECPLVGAAVGDDRSILIVTLRGKLVCAACQTDAG